MTLIFQTIEEKIDANEPLSFDEGLVLFKNFDLHRLGSLADRVRRRRHGRKAYYVVNAHLNPTNVCRIGCPLCAFAAYSGETRGYTLDLDAIRERVRHAVEFGATQLHLVSSVHPDKPYDWYRDIVSTVRETGPDLKIKAWTAVEIENFAKISGLGVDGVLSDMQSLGLRSMPGGGAEIFNPEVRETIAPDKISAEVWLDVHRRAHRLGIPTNASMLFGHIETIEHRVDHLLRLRALQDETGGFDCFIPLVFHPKNTKIDAVPVSPQEILRTIAISRLMLHNIEHIKAYWVTLGESLAQVALSYGADDFDGTVFEERIHHDAGSAAPRGLSVRRLQELISGAGCEPSLSTTNLKDREFFS